MRTSVEYVTNNDPGSVGTVHLAATFEARERTLCGLRVGDRWERGDETVSGIAATCRSCRRAFDAGAS